MENGTFIVTALLLGNLRYGIGTVDRILSNQTRVFGEDGRWVTVHEYGHAFHRVALEPMASYFCSDDGEHSVGGAYTLSCALGEGFPDFFAAWVAGDRLTSSYGNSDYWFEQNGYRGNGDGSIIEGAVAGFFLDLVDSSSGPGPNYGR